MLREASSLLCAGILAACTPSERAARPDNDDPVEIISPADTAFHAAIDRARQTLPFFFARFTHPQPGDRQFELKVRLVEDAGPEHVWLDRLRNRGGQLVGHIANVPVALATYHFGDSLVIDTSAVSDWLLVGHDTMYGGYTFHLTRSRQDSAARVRDAAARDYVIPDTPRP